jgi:hypothetical protein
MLWPDPGFRRRKPELQRRRAKAAKEGDAMRTPFARRSILIAAAAPLAAPWVSRAQSLKSEYKLSVVGNRPIPLSASAFEWAELVT